jgi:hypothetical protein
MLDERFEQSEMLPIDLVRTKRSATPPRQFRKTRLSVLPIPEADLPPMAADICQPELESRSGHPVNLRASLRTNIGEAGEDQVRDLG